MRYIQYQGDTLPVFLVDLTPFQYLAQTLPLPLVLAFHLVLYNFYISE